ncbi:hypothetical protein DPEC_G00268540 [Dallia pectoralis]|uniref:Uncharacterized protein n=1 Tax=Dallia pectoralis TaxID=75939 RepID=A0ACC2FP53_DALPE|nr:hypothetical protein DPEC_G00268540 [Dallia pectoralis]
MLAGRPAGDPGCALQSSVFPVKLDWNKVPVCASDPWLTCIPFGGQTRHFPAHVLRERRVLRKLCSPGTRGGCSQAKEPNLSQQGSKPLCDRYEKSMTITLD